MDSNALEQGEASQFFQKYSGSLQRYADQYCRYPGHADFGGEVERVLGMVDGCILMG